MVTANYNSPRANRNGTRSQHANVVNIRILPALSAGLNALLECIPEPGDVMDLDNAIAILSRHEPHAYGALVAMMERGLVSADFIDAPSIDPEIVIRRI